MNALRGTKMAETYKVVVHETVELTYDIRGDSAVDAYRKYTERDSGRAPECGEPDEDTLGTQPIKVISPDGTETAVDDLEESVALQAVQAAQRGFWDALRKLEHVVGGELPDDLDFGNQTPESIKQWTPYRERRPTTNTAQKGEANGV